MLDVDSVSGCLSASGDDIDLTISGAEFRFGSISEFIASWIIGSGVRQLTEPEDNTKSSLPSSQFGHKRSFKLHCFELECHQLPVALRLGGVANPLSSLPVLQKLIMHAKLCINFVSILY